MKPLKYHNVMEEQVERVFDSMKADFDCCTCDVCRCDMIAFALNNVRPKYVVTPSGELIGRVDSVSSQNSSDIVAALTKASMIISKNPRH